MAALGPAHALVHALRQRGSETELTQALGAVLRTDGRLATDFVRVVVRAARHGDRIDLRNLATKLNVRVEETVSTGRTDLTFFDDAEDWRVFVELKIHAGYGDMQLDRYLRALRPHANGVLVAITRDVPTYGDLDDSRDPRWAGSVRWATVLDDLRRLRPSDPDLATQWPLFLDVLESEGSMGFTTADLDLFRAWERAVPARDHVAELVDAVRRPLLDVLRMALVEAGQAETPAAAADFFTRGKVKRAVLLSQRKIGVSFRVPAAGPARIFAGFWAYGDLRFVVETPYPSGEPHAVRDAVGRLVDARFRSWRDRHLERFLRIDEDLLRGPSLQEELVEFGRDSFAAIVQSGVLGLHAEEIAEPQDEPASEALQA